MLILCCGMFRSGSTLQYNIVRQIVEYRDLGQGEGWLGDHSEGKRLDAFRDWALDDKIHVAKVHNLARREVDEFPQWGNKLRLFHTYRDLRDVAVSLRKKFDTSDEDIIGSLDEAISVLQLVEDRFEEVLFVQKYEDMNKDLRTSIARHAEAIDCDIDDAYMDELSQKLSINGSDSSIRMEWLFKMLEKILPARFFFSLRPWSRKTLYHVGHVSDHKGKEGVWREELSPDLTQEIENRYQEWMIEKLYIG